MMKSTWIWIMMATTMMLSPLVNASPPVSSKPKPPSGDNAAVGYWQAFAMLPVLNTKEKKILGNCMSTPLNAASKKIVKKSKPSLAMVLRASKQEYCDWQLQKEKGVEAIMPHLSKARMVARLEILQARWNLKDGKPLEAIDNLMAALTLCRHVGEDGPLISYLVQVAIEAMIIETVAEHLTELDRRSLKILNERLEAAPQGATLATAFASERGFLDAQKTHPLYESAVKLWDQLSGMGELPPQEFERKLKKIKNPALPPGIEKVSYTQAAARTKLAMLKAAITMLLEGKEKLNSIKDPYGDGPFEYIDLGKGFQLRSSLKVKKDHQPVTLTVGTRK